MIARAKPFAFTVLAASLLATGCGLNMQKHYSKMRANMMSHNYQAADKYLESQKEKFYGEDNRLLYYMDRGMVLHLGKQYQQSNSFLQKADDAAQELWTDSISKNIAAMFTTDNSVPYQGEDFEKVAVNIMAALNYVALGDYGAARVEARQVTNQLALYSQKYEEMEQGSIGAYRDDAFARWLSGKMRALEGTFEGHNEAWIEYRQALKLYEEDYAQRYGVGVPLFVIEDTLLTLEYLGGQFREEMEMVRSKFPEIQAPSKDEAQSMGEVVLVHLNGEAPYKIDRYWDATAAGELIRVAYPEFVARVPQIVGARMSSSVGVTARTELGEPWTNIAIQNLNDHMGRIKAKAIARAVTKYLAAKGMQEAGKQAGGDGGAALQLVGALFQAGSYLAEEADKRSWITLPAAVNIGRMFVPPGPTTVDVQFVSRNGSVLEKKSFDVNAEAGKTTFLFYRTYR